MDRAGLDSLAEWLGAQIDVERIGQSSIFRIQMTHPRPQFAVSLIEMAHGAADALLREEAQDRIGRQIGEVESEIASATSPSHKQALEQMLTEQYQAQALLRVDQPYRRPDPGAGLGGRRAELAQSAADPRAGRGRRRDPRPVRRLPARRPAERTSMREEPSRDRKRSRCAGTGRLGPRLIPS